MDFSHCAEHIVGAIIIITVVAVVVGFVVVVNKLANNLSMLLTVHY